jgi:DNA replication factor GINS
MSELKERGLTKLEQDFYKKVADQLRLMKIGDDEGREDVAALLIRRERELLYEIVKRILEVRVSKACELSEFDDKLNLLTPEEKFIIDASHTFRRRLDRVSEAIEMGRTSFLDRISKEISKRRIVVRFLKDSPAIVGTELKRYGPFRKEDVAILPAENAKAFIRAGIAEEVEVEP